MEQVYLDKGLPTIPLSTNFAPKMGRKLCISVFFGGSAVDSVWKTL